MKKIALAVSSLVVFASAPVSAASLNLITNGDFSQTTLTQSHQFSGTEVTGWTNAKTSGYTGYGYNFLILNGQTADGAGFFSNGGNHDYLYGPNGGNYGVGDKGDNYAKNGLTAISGNYLLLDGDTNFHGAVSQTIGGLTVGNAYTLNFNWAGATWATTPGDTTHMFDVTFGNQIQSTAKLSLGQKGFTGWQNASMTFIANSTSQTLSFLAQGTPNGLPPTLLLDNVSMTAAVPEPATWALMLVGFGMVGASARYRRRKTTAAIA